MKKFLLILLVLVILSTPVHAWWKDTHVGFAEKVCKDFNCSCMEEVAEGAMIPDRVFHDTRRHSCYTETFECAEGEWICPYRDYCPALEETKYRLELAKNLTGCERWNQTAIAAHYFSDSKVFFHKVSKESSSCHSGLERKVANKFKYKEINWEVCQCGICVKYEEFMPWIEEFENMIDFETKVKNVPLIVPKEKITGRVTSNKLPLRLRIIFFLRRFFS